MAEYITLRTFLKHSTAGEIPEGYVYFSKEKPIAHLHLLAEEYAFFWLGRVAIGELASLPEQMLTAADNRIRQFGFPAMKWSFRATCSYEEYGKGQSAELRGDTLGNFRFFALKGSESEKLLESSSSTKDLLDFSFSKELFYSAFGRLSKIYAAHFFLESISGRHYIRLWATTKESPSEYPEVGLAGNIPITDFALGLFSQSSTALPNEADLKSLLYKHLEDNTLRYFPK